MILKLNAHYGIVRQARWVATPEIWEPHKVGVVGEHFACDERSLVEVAVQHGVQRWLADVVLLLERSGFQPRGRIHDIERGQKRDSDQCGRRRSAPTHSVS